MIMLTFSKNWTLKPVFKSLPFQFPKTPLLWKLRAKGHKNEIFCWKWCCLKTSLQSLQRHTFIKILDCHFRSSWLSKLFYGVFFFLSHWKFFSETRFVWTIIMLLTTVQSIERTIIQSLTASFTFPPKIQIKNGCPY